MPTKEKQEPVEAVGFDPQPDANEVIQALQQQIGNLTVQLIASQLAAGKALARLAELSAPSDASSSD